MASKKKSLIFIPTYNEKENVGPIAEAVLALPLNADVVFLDDNSPDGTGQFLDAIAKKNPRVQVIHRTGKQGIGSAHQAGIAYAYDNGYERLITMDCDFTHSPSDVTRLVEESEGAAVTVGSRHLEADSLPDWSITRTLLTRVGHRLTAAALGFAYDATGALRVYDLKRIPRATFALVRQSGYAFFFESLFVIHQNGLRIREVPIVLPARTYGNSKMTLREVQRSVNQLASLAVAKRVNPAQFMLPKDPEGLKTELTDPQNWNEYWDKKAKKTGVAYELIAATYRNMVIRRRLTDEITREFPEGAKLLHAGCGSGQVDMDLHRHAQITAIDISLSALRMYSAANPQAHEVRHASIFELPFPDASFDGAYNLGVVEHFDAEELQRAFKELRRVIKPGGKLLIFWPHANATSVMVLNTAHWVLNDVMGRSDRLHPPEVSLVRNRADAKQRLEAAGFALEKYSFGPKDMFVQSVVVARRN